MVLYYYLHFCYSFLDGFYGIRIRTDVPRPLVKTNVSETAIATVEAESLLKTVNFTYYSSGVSTENIVVMSVFTLR